MRSCTVTHMNLTTSQKRDHDQYVKRMTELGVRLLQESARDMHSPEGIEIHEYVHLLDQFKDTIKELNKVHERLVDIFCETTYN